MKINVFDNFLIKNLIPNITKTNLTNFRQMKSTRKNIYDIKLCVDINKLEQYTRIITELQPQISKFFKALFNIFS